MSYYTDEPSIDGNVPIPPASTSPAGRGTPDEPVFGSAQAWHDTAAQMHRNAEYYRGLVVQIGEMLGPEAYVSDDGSVQQDVLCAKVPELVQARLTTSPARDQAIAALKRASGYIDHPGRFDAALNSMIDTALAALLAEKGGSDD